MRLAHKFKIAVVSISFLSVAGMRSWSEEAKANATPVLETLVNFNLTDGAGPFGPLVQAPDGDFYGTTTAGGASDNGTIFKITPGGTLTTLHSFDGKDGASPFAGLVQATDGNFYGTTSAGGAGHGTVFKFSPSCRTLTTLHKFDGTDGDSPEGLVQAADGSLYGATNQGGTNFASCSNGCGTIFKITPGGTLTTLYNFCMQASCADGAVPNELVQSTDGNFYGPTLNGGTNNGGTVFKITPAGKLTTLYSFCAQTNCTDGLGPDARLVQATDGNFYGTTRLGGANTNSCPGLFGCGTVFKITPCGRLTTLHSFDGADGQIPQSELVQATDGNLYGTTDGGSCPGQCGTVFKITLEGELTTLHTFDGSDGAFPRPLVQGTDTNFYGTTFGGGTHNNCNFGCGTVFSLSVGLGPFVETRPTSGKAGTTIEILGNDLTSASSVTFNGTAANFDVMSGSEITATVPVGATTGKVEVVTPSGTLSSNLVFRVTQ
ncbi:MAG: hypothetical protein JOY62_16020 [Acidobacteriaceae bacterium]|nr:hypothetical protein [Acidobacteriaceae bacterium]MBV9781470.1 hypothetical protein [Acidobacteriaceae bacterium]